MPWYLYFAWKQLFPSKKRLPFFSAMSIIGVLLGVMVLIIVQSVMNGFAFEIANKVRSTSGDMQVVTGEIMTDYETVMESLRKDPEILVVEPYAEGIVMAQHRDLPAFPFIYGIPLGQEKYVLPLENIIRAGSMDDLDHDSVLLSSGLSRALRAPVGTIVEVYTPLMLELMKKDEVLLPRELRVAGIFEVGWNQIDSNAMICSLQTMQDLYGLDDGIHGLRIKVKHPEINAITELAGKWEKTLPINHRVITWFEVNGDLLFVLQLEKNMMFFIIMFIVLVASFSISITLTISVVRKTREIGLLMAMGASRFQVAAGFCLQGFVIGILGTTFGILLAILSLSYRNEIVGAFARITNGEAALLKFYQFANLPVHYQISDFVVVTILSILLSTLAGAIPAWRITKMNAAEALRHD